MNRLESYLMGLVTGAAGANIYRTIKEENDKIYRKLDEHKEMSEKLNKCTC